MTKRIQETTKLMGKSGAKCVAFLGISGGTHLKFNVTAPNGVARKVFMSLTPSDGRGDLNNFSKVRQFCRANAA